MTIKSAHSLSNEKIFNIHINIKKLTKIPAPEGLFSLLFVTITVLFLLLFVYFTLFSNI